MENAETDATIGPWRACARPAPFPSREHMLLAEALAIVVDAEHYISPARMVEALTTATPDWLDRSDRLDVADVIRKLHGSILRGELQNVRPTPRRRTA